MPPDSPREAVEGAAWRRPGVRAPSGAGGRGDCTASASGVDIASMRRRWRAMQRVVGAALFASLGLGCDPRPPLRDPLTLHNPFPSTQLWAVAPFSNESGVSHADGSRVADQFVKVIEETEGLSCVALNRTLAAMQTLGMRAVRTDADAVTLLEAMGVDGLVIGTISMWDPYPPPKIGLAAQLYVRPGMTNPATFQPIDPAVPASAASGSFDASNHATLAALRRYSDARHQPGGPYGDEIYLVEMSRYAEFASHEILARILQSLLPPPCR